MHENSNSPAAAESQNAKHTWIAVVLTVIAPLIPLWVLIYVVPQHVKLFQDFNAALPGLTVFTISLSTFLMGYAILWFPLYVAFAAVCIFLRKPLQRIAPKGGCLIGGFVIAIFCAILSGAFIFSVKLPLRDLTEALTH